MKPAKSNNHKAPFTGAVFDNSYARLPGRFYSRVGPTPVDRPSLIRLNLALAEALGLDADALASDQGVETMAGNRPAAGAEPIAMAYAGHQFANWVPQLGDGRTLLLGEVIDRDGRRRDIQLKGSGPTPFSRGGDGRSSIGPVVREYLASEAMHALGIPTTRALAALATGEQVLRNRPEPGGILVRVADSHVRVGTFEYFARNGDPASVRTLADYVIDRHFPDLVDGEQPYLAFFSAVIERTAYLVAEWMRVGFIHGVMNTDNTSVVGETIDFGPFGWMDEFHPATVYSSIDRRGRYAFNQQPGIAHWNLARLGECLLPLFDASGEAALEKANTVLGTYQERFERHFHAVLRAKLGLAEQRDGDIELAEELLSLMTEQRADMTLTFRRLGELHAQTACGDGPVRELFEDASGFDAWAGKWRQRLGAESRGDDERRQAMRRTNPAFVLRNHLAQQAVDVAIERLDFQPMHRLAEVLARPYDDQPDNRQYAQPPHPEERVLKTFCGT
jgi:serine/tyrosine/threonine adenylyltransferase